MMLPSNKHPMYYQRLNRDISDLLSYDFNCSSSCLSVIKDQSGISLNVCILEGPYDRGHFSFLLDIPINYPFKKVEVWAKQPIWHPNIELLTGRVLLPLDWSPVLTLNSLALAVQMILLEPSIENILNHEASTYYASDQKLFANQVQLTLRGCRFVGIDFPSVLYNNNCSNCNMKSVFPTVFESSSSSSSLIPSLPGSHLFLNGKNRKKYNDEKLNNERYAPTVVERNINTIANINVDVNCDVKIINENENEMDIMNSFSPKRRKREIENEEENYGKKGHFSGQTYLNIEDNDVKVNNYDDNNNCHNIYDANDTNRNGFSYNSISTNLTPQNIFIASPSYIKYRQEDKKEENLNKRMRTCDDVIAISSFNGLSLEKVNNIIPKW